MDVAVGLLLPFLPNIDNLYVQYMDKAGQPPVANRLVKEILDLLSLPPPQFSASSRFPTNLTKVILHLENYTKPQAHERILDVMFLDVPIS
jgi:hypothetical protein